MRRRRIGGALVAAALLVLVAPAAAVAAYGAIAVNERTDVHSVSLANTKAGAAGAAKEACGSDCVLVALVRTECAAVVHVGGHYSAGFGKTKLAALRQARRRAGHPDARVTGWICPGPGGAFSDYVALAINRQNGRHAFAFAPTLSSAEHSAKQTCGRGCEVLAWMFNGCAAVVHVGRRYWPGVGRDRAGAFQNARRHAGHADAAVTVWACTKSTLVVTPQSEPGPPPGRRPHP